MAATSLLLAWPMRFHLMLTHLLLPPCMMAAPPTTAQLICAVCSRSSFPVDVTFVMCDECPFSFCELCLEHFIDEDEVREEQRTCSRASHPRKLRVWRHRVVQ